MEEGWGISEGISIIIIEIKKWEKDARSLDTKS